MAEIVAGFAGAAIEVVKWFAQPILRQFNYLCCFATNIDALNHEAEELDLATRGLQEQVDRETENVRVIVPEVESWLTKSKNIKEENHTILNQVPDVKSGCLKLGARFSLSKRAKKTADSMKELRERRNFAVISQPGPPAATQEIPLGNIYEFESRKKIEEDIMTTLRDEDANMIGIHGMGGLGKTTIAQKIMNRVLKEQVFEEVVMTVISQQVDRSKVQVEIGGSLGLNLQHETSQVRVQKLHARLTGTKRILLVLDDVWEGLELEGLGIPCDSKKCKILVTSRNKDVLSEMGVEKVFGMEVLPLKDAWFLFRERAGTCVDENKLNPIAKEVVDECGGLPIALNVVGAALKGEKDLSIWKDALRGLRQCDQDIPNFIEKVYNPLKLSYDFLRSQQAKSLLLLCCLFPEDDSIPLWKLTYFCMGLGLFEGIKNVEGSRNKIRSLAKMLKSRSLLLDGSFIDHVRMHDVVRDVCKIIAKHGKYIGGNDCAWISSSELIEERHSGLGYPSLRLLFSSHQSEFKEEFKFDGVFLEGIRDLHVLWMEYSSLTSLPHATQQLKNLNTLVLHSCQRLKTISVVGELVSLEILKVSFCYGLKELPPQIKGLNRLKLLQLTECRKLQSIERGIISSLVGLEELSMLGSFNKWEGEDREERRNAGLKELQALTNLTCLEIEIEDSTLAAENMYISTMLQRFRIRFTKTISLPHECYLYDKRMTLWLERETCLGHWIETQLLRKSESLSLWGNGAQNVDFASCPNIRWLKLSYCENDAFVLPGSLKYIELNSLPRLQEIRISFQDLSSITITDCPRLPNLAINKKDCFPQLEDFYIQRCEMVEQVLSWKEEDNIIIESRINPHVTFPKLKEVHLDSLPNLATFCQGIHPGIEFPLLKNIFIEKCPKFKSMVSCNGILESKESKSGGDISSSNADINDEYSSHLFCQLQVSFGNLKQLAIGRNPFCGHRIPASSSYSGLEILNISGYGGSRSLLSSSIAINLVNLKSLFIDKCDEMIQVIKDDDEEEENRRILGNTNNGGERPPLFPKLEELTLTDLPKLVSFCEWECDVVLPSLRRVTIQKCPNMKNWSLGYLAAPNLEALTTDFNHLLELGLNVSLDRLKALRIEEVGNIGYPFYHHNFFISLVDDGLEKLNLHSHGSMSLFPSSFAEKLVNLRSLGISYCGEMVKAIEDDKVASGGRTTLVFPKLEELELAYLRKLESFFGSECVVELPSLRKVRIIGCPMMKSFSLGPLNSPNLKFIEIDDEQFGGERGLNGVLQERYSARAKEDEKEVVHWSCDPRVR